MRPARRSRRRPGHHPRGLRATRVEVSLGLEQLRELADSPDQVVFVADGAGGTVLEWHGDFPAAARAAVQSVMVPVSPFPRTLTALLAAAPAAGPVYRVPVTDPGWRPRPTFAEFMAAGLADKVAYLEGLLGFTGVMSRDQARTLAAACTRQADRAAALALYQSSMNGGFEGAALQLQCYRGAAAISAAVDLVPVLT